MIFIALPNKTFNYAVLSDAPHERAISLVKRHVHNKDLEGLETAVGTLGGRLTDLRLFINKIRSGQKPNGTELFSEGSGDFTSDYYYLLY